MKVKDLDLDVQDAINTELEEKAVEILIRKKKEILSCEKTLKKLKKKYDKFLESDIEDLELDGFEY